MMKKILAMILALSLLVAGCGGAKSKTIADPIKVADDMLAVLAPQGELLEVTDGVLDNYYTLDSAVFEGHKIYISTSFIAEEVAVFSVKDGKTAEAKKVLEQRLTDLKKSFDGYRQEELASLTENAKVLEGANLVCLLAGTGDGRAAAEKVFVDATK